MNKLKFFQTLGSTEKFFNASWYSVIEWNFFSSFVIVNDEECDDVVVVDEIGCDCCFSVDSIAIII